MSSSELLMSRLREKPGPHLRAIEELTKFRDRAKIFSLYEDEPHRFAYLLISGHPSTNGKSPTVILGGAAESAAQLLEHLPKVPFTILETSREFVNILRSKIPDTAEIFYERRMELKRASFKAVASSRVRRLLETDDVSLAEFNGAPPQAAFGMRNCNGFNILFNP
jgi:hypothetical protein